MAREPAPHNAASSKEPIYEGKTLSAWVAQSKQKDSATRQFAISGLRHFGPAGVPAIAELLNDERGDVRREASETLGKLGPEAKSAVPALIESCRTGDYYLVDANVESLRKIGPAAVPAIAGLLGDKEKEIRLAAARALGKMGADAVSAVPILQDRVKECDDSVSDAAASSLARIGLSAVPTLAGLLKDKDWFVRWRAAWTLRGMGSRANSAAPALVSLLADGNVIVREAAAEALGRIGAVNVPVLTAMLKDKDASVRYAAAKSLGKTDKEAEAIAHELVYFGNDTGVFRSNISSDAECRALYARECEKSWDSLMREAGAAKEGLVLESRPNVVARWYGFQIGLIVSLKNVGDLPFGGWWTSVDALPSIFSDIYGDGFGPQPSVFIRNSKNEFVELSGGGHRRVF